MRLSNSKSQWCSRSTLAFDTIVPRIKLHCGQKFMCFSQKITAIRSFGHGLHT